MMEALLNNSDLLVEGLNLSDLLVEGLNLKRFFAFI